MELPLESVVPRLELVQPQVVLFDDLDALLQESLSRMKFI